MTTEGKAQMSSAQQALRIMEADGEAAMWHFITSIARIPNPTPQPEPEPSRTALLDDGSLVHMVGGAYVFDTFPFHPDRTKETRKSSHDASRLPAAFQKLTPLFLWPNHLNLYNRVIEHLFDQVEELPRNDDGKAQAPDPSFIQELTQTVHEAVNRTVPTTVPASANLTDHLGDYMDDLAHDILDKLDPGVRDDLIRHIDAVASCRNDQRQPQKQPAA